MKVRNNYQVEKEKEISVLVSQPRIRKEKEEIK